MGVKGKSALPGPPEFFIHLSLQFMYRVTCSLVSCFVLISAVASVDTAMGLSIYSSTSLEEVAQESPDTVKFLQVQFLTDRQVMATLLKRAEKAAYKGVLLTVDSPTYSKHKGRDRFYLPEHLHYANFSAVQKEKGFQNNEEFQAYIDPLCADCSADWKAFDWLRSITSLPLIVKGILTAEDARLAVQHGVQGILVSNHGGRQLDGVHATVCVINFELSIIWLFKKLKTLSVKVW